MALQSTGPISMKNIKDELGSTSNILRVYSEAAGKTAPHSIKEFLGYGSSSGQTINTGTTITNSFGDSVIVLPEEQHSIAIIHYSELNTEREPEKFFKYEDYISTNNKLIFEDDPLYSVRLCCHFYFI